MLRPGSFILLDIRADAELFYEEKVGTASGFLFISGFIFVHLTNQTSLLFNLNGSVLAWVRSITAVFSAIYS